jgi:hypothetical protein
MKIAREPPPLQIFDTCSPRPGHCVAPPQAVARRAGTCRSKRASDARGSPRSEDFREKHIKMHFSCG